MSGIPHVSHKTISFDHKTIFHFDNFLGSPHIDGSSSWASFVFPSVRNHIAWLEWPSHTISNSNFGCSTGHNRAMDQFWMFKKILQPICSSIFINIHGFSGPQSPHEMKKSQGLGVLWGSPVGRPDADQPRSRWRRPSGTKQDLRQELREVSWGCTLDVGYLWEISIDFLGYTLKGFHGDYWMGIYIVNDGATPSYHPSILDGIFPSKPSISRKPHDCGTPHKSGYTWDIDGISSYLGIIVN